MYNSGKLIMRINRVREQEHKSELETGVSQEEVALNRRRNKVDMEKVFATVISLAIMVALVVGVVSILRSNNSEGDNKQNYIDLNEINEALGETEQTQSREEQSNVAKNDDKNSPTVKGNDEKNTLKDDNTAVKPSKDSGEGRDSDVAKNSDGKGQRNEEDAVEQESTAAQQAQGDDAEAGAAVASGEPADGDGVQEGVQTADSEGLQAGVQAPEGESAQAETKTAEGDMNPAHEQADDTVPVNASTANILGYSFGEDSSMMWPTVGNVILNYNMSNTIYFPTLDVYRCNPAIVISAPEDSLVSAAADGLVIAVYETNETGLTMEIALGNDYVMTYGQLKNLTVGVGSQVKRGDVLAAVAAPSQYYTVEGSNLYFKLDKAGTSVNPMDFIDAE